MRSPRRALLVAALLAATNASAADTVPKPFCPHGGPPKCKGPLTIGDPVFGPDLTTWYPAEDLTVSTGNGALAFRRMYVSSDYTWMQVTPDSWPHLTDLLPKPFGATRADASTGRKVSSMRWWSNYTSFIAEMPNRGTYRPLIVVRDTSGVQTAFTPLASCSAPPCELSPDISNPSAPHRLFKTNSPPGYVLRGEDGVSLFFHDVYDPRVADHPRWYMLTRAEGAGARRLFSVTYNLPRVPQGTCPYAPAPGTPNGGAPYISRVLGPGGEGFEFFYAGRTNALGALECPIAEVRTVASNNAARAQLPPRRFQEVPGQGGPPVPPPAPNLPFATYGVAAVFSYAGDGLVAKASLVTAAGAPFAEEEYTYQAGFIRKRGGAVVASQTYGAQDQVSASTGEGASYSFVTGAQQTVDCDQGSQCCVHVRLNPPGLINPPILRLAEATAGRGDGSPGTAALGQAFLYARDYEFGLHGARLYKTADACPAAPESCSAGAVRYEHRGAPAASTPPATVLECRASAPGYLHAVKDKRGNFTVTPSVWANPPGSARKVLEQRQTLRGATDIGGVTALEKESHTYFYDAQGRQLPEKTSRESLLGTAGASTVSAKRYEPSGRLEADYLEGYTLAPDGTVEAQPRRVKTFYKTARACEPSAADPHGRTLRIEGPCLVAQESATSCPSASVFAVTEFTYYPDTAPGAKGGRLQKMVRYPGGGACGDGLAEDYLDYSVEGQPLEVRDANGVVTAYEYEGRNVTARTVGGKVWRYRYTQGLLAEVVSPEGNREVFCHQKDTPGAGCTGGTFTPLLQWKAKTSNTFGSTWSEKVTYTYRAADQKLISEERRDACPASCSPSSGEVRSVRRYDADLHGRPTFEALGKPGTPSAQATRGFDGADNLVAIGHAFSSPPAFCRAGGAPSPLCAQLGYDAANRLVELKEIPSTGQVAATRLAYDKHGNVCAVTSGASAGWALASECQVAAPDDAKTAYYRHDDFGRVVEARLPNSAQGTTRGVARFGYNAQGELVFRQTFGMQDGNVWVAHSYDGLGRQLTTRREFSGGSDLLFRTTYDSAGPPLPGCPVLTYTRGRPARIEDPVGTTLLSYNAEGRLLLEARLGPGATGCGPPHEDGSAHTEYAYTPNGNLASVTYPHGRKVTYAYASGLGREDRVTSVFTGYFRDGAWTTAQVLGAVSWEPYGGLRAYTGLDPGAGGVAFWVGYHLGDESSAPKASPCTASTGVPSQLSDDETGRLRALFVSRGAGVGNVFRRWYTYKGEMLTQTQTCLLGNGPTGEAFGYDGMLRVTSASSNPAAAVDSASFQWDARGNPLVRGISGAGAYDFTLHPSPLRPDSVVGVSANRADTHISLTYGYDLDGRVKSVLWPLDSSGERNDARYFLYGPDEQHGGVDSAMNAASVRGQAYFNYYFDAQGRRRMKVHPSGAADVFFYDTGRQLLEDRGVAHSFGHQFDDVPIDDYVWLDGRPVVLIRGRFAFDLPSGQRVRQDDGPGDCTRNDEPTRCGVYFPVNDGLGKPVLLLDSQGRIAGTGEYDVFGHVNRRQVWGESQHPYPGGVAVQAPVIQQAALGLELDMRVQFHTLDTAACPQASLVLDPVFLVNSATSQSVGPYGGYHKGSLWSDWLKASPGGQVHVAFTATSARNAPDQNGCATGAVGFPYSGYSVRQAEFRRYEAGAMPAWFPLRFPGQYHDAETDLFENWHRNYDAFGGRYLQPEPLLTRRPEAAAQPVYAYAKNNPISNADPSGLFIRKVLPYGLGPQGCPNWFPALEEAKRRAGCEKGGGQCNECSRGLPCDICPLLEEGHPPLLEFLDLNRDRRWWEDEVTGRTILNLPAVGPPSPFAEVQIDWSRCNGPEQISKLAGTIIHEAAHVCAAFGGRLVADPEAGDIEKKCRK